MSLVVNCCMRLGQGCWRALKCAHCTKHTLCEAQRQRHSTKTVSRACNMTSEKQALSDVANRSQTLSSHENVCLNKWLKFHTLMKCVLILSRTTCAKQHVFLKINAWRSSDHHWIGIELLTGISGNRTRRQLFLFFNFFKIESQFYSSNVFYLSSNPTVWHIGLWPCGMLLTTRLLTWWGGKKKACVTCSKKINKLSVIFKKHNLFLLSLEMSMTLTLVFSFYSC